jgi:hypothetical protein
MTEKSGPKGDLGMDLVEETDDDDEERRPKSELNITEYERLVQNRLGTSPDGDYHDDDDDRTPSIPDTD